MENIALNAVEELAVVGFESTRLGRMTVLRRSTMPEDLIKPIVDDLNLYGVYCTELRARLPSQLPPPGHGKLEATLGACIGHGHSSVVYALDNVMVSGISPPVCIPPLVVKVARLNRVTSLMREAWFYDEMEVLQGVSIARCYGYFTVRFDEGPLQEERRKAERTYPHHDNSGENPVLFWDREAGPLHQLLEDQSRRTDLLAVLVLERLGTPLPLGFPVPEVTRKEIEDLYRDMACLGVTNSIDIRLPNILEAPPAPSGLPSLPSPFSAQVHSWRAIDLEMAIKTNRSVKGLALDYKCQLHTVFREAETMFADEVGSEEDRANGQWVDSDPETESCENSSDAES